MNHHHGQNVHHPAGHPAHTRHHAHSRIHSYFGRNSNHIFTAMFILAFVTIGLALLVMSRAATPLNSVKSGNWNDPTVWGGRVPGSSDIPVINSGHTVTYNVTNSVVAGMQVKAGGVLAYKSDQSATLESSENIIVNGKLMMMPASPAVKHTLRFINVDETKMVGGGMDPVASDVGLWVMSGGTLDAVGSPKTAWVRTTGSVSAGSTTVSLDQTVSGWQAGDEISIAPTEKPSTFIDNNTGQPRPADNHPFYKGFDVSPLAAAANGASSVSLSTPTARAHPMVNGKWTAEVMNLTRNVMIEGTPGHKSHIFIRSDRPQTIKHTAIRHMGVLKGTSEVAPEGRSGRYGLHFHMMADASRGSLTEGVVLRDQGSHTFVTHGSHGVTHKDAISYNSIQDAFWWDGSINTREPGIPTDDTLIEHSVAALALGYPDDNRDYRIAGFNLGEGLGNTIRNSVAVGGGGTSGSAGFGWPEDAGQNTPGNGVWDFSVGNVAHNNHNDGMFVWQNTAGLHDVSNFVLYHNGMYGIEHGAYGNVYIYMNGEIYGSGRSGIRTDATAFNSPRQIHYENLIIDQLGLTDYIIETGEHQNGGATEETATEAPMVFKNNTFRGSKKAVVHAFLDPDPERRATEKMDFFNNSFSGNEFLLDSNVVQNSILRVVNGSAAYSVTRFDKPGELITAWNARKNTIAPFSPPADRMPPAVTVRSPMPSSTVSGIVPVTTYAFDNTGITKVDFYVDGTLRATDTSAPYTFNWDTTGLAAGSKHQMWVNATDTAGNTMGGIATTPLKGTYFIGNATTPPPPTDTTPPAVSISSPANGATLSGTTTISASASDNVSVSHVEFYVDGILKGTDNSSPYSYALDTTVLSSAQHGLTAKAFDTSGNSATSPLITVSVSNQTTPPVVYRPEDINKDGSVNLLDFSILSSWFGQSGTNLGRADINQDGSVNILDFSLLAAKFGT